MEFKEIIENLKEIENHKEIRSFISELRFETRFNCLRELIYHIDLYLSEGNPENAHLMLNIAEKISLHMEEGSESRITDKVRALKIITKKKRAKYHENMGNYREAIAQYNIIISQLNLPREEAFLAEMLMEIGILEEQTGKKQDALKKFSKAITLYHRKNDEFNYQAAMFNCAHVLYDMKYFDKAREFCLALINKHKGTKKMLSPIAHSYLEMANIKELFGFGADARAYYKSALDAYRELDEKVKMSDILNRVGAFEREDGNITSAATIFHEALDIKRTLDFQCGKSVFFENMGDTHRFANNYEEALKYYSWAYHYCDEAGISGRKPPIKHKIYKILARLGLEEKDMGTYFEDFSINISNPQDIIELERRDYSEIVKDDPNPDTAKEWNTRRQFRGNRKFLVYLLRNLKKTYLDLGKEDEFERYSKLQNVVENDEKRKKKKNT